MASGLKEHQAKGIVNRWFFTNVTGRMALPFTALFVRAGIGPTAVTLLSVVVAVAAATVVVVASTWPLRAAAAAGLLLSLVLDHSDGQVARRTGRQSVQGGLLDSLMDRFVEASWIAALGIALARHPGLGSGLLAPELQPLLALAAAAAFLYHRYSLQERNLVLLRAELRAAAPSGHLDLQPRKRAPASEEGIGRSFRLPIHLERDAFLWLAAAIPLLPAWDIGLAALAALLLARALEANVMTFRDLRRGTPVALKLAHPDNH